MAERLRQLDPSRLADYTDRLHASAWALCGNREWAEDLVQETYARVLARPRFLRNDDDFGYLLRALRNTFFQQLKQEKHQPRGEAIGTDNEPIDIAGRMKPEREAETRAVYAAIDQLPDDFRFALLAVDVAGFSYEEAANTLGTRTGTVRSRLFRARGRVADLLDDRPKPARAVRLWIMNNGPRPAADVARLVAPFERRTGIDVQIEVVEWGEQFDRIRNAAITGNGPDVTQVGTTQVPYFASLGLFDDLSRRIRDLGGKQAYPPGVWRTTQVTGNVGTYAIPWFTETRAIYYRRDLLRAAGIDPEHAFGTWAEFETTLRGLAAANKERADPIEPFGGSGVDSALVHILVPRVWAAGGRELSRDASHATIDSRAAVTALEYASRLVADGLWSGDTLKLGNGEVEQRFKDGRIAVYIGGPFMLGSRDRRDDYSWNTLVRHNVGVSPMPRGESGRAYAFVGGSNLMLFRAARDKDAAWQLIRYLSTDRAQDAYGDLLGISPARLQTQSRFVKPGRDYTAFEQSIQVGRSYEPVPSWAQIENVYIQRFADILHRATKRDFDRAVLKRYLAGAAREADKLLDLSEPVDTSGRPPPITEAASRTSRRV